MNNTQKIIKYLALAFAAFLIFSIVTGIMGGILSMAYIFDQDDSISESLKPLEAHEDFQELEIDIKATNVTIKDSDTFRLETNNSKIKVKNRGHKLFISEKSNKIFGNHKNSELVISLPSTLSLEKVKMDTGAGKLEIAKLTTRDLELNLGAGSVHIDTLTATEEASINGGAGEIIIEDGSLHNLDLDLGVGRVALTSKLTGSSDIDAGVGEVELNLLGSISDYQMIVDKGIGETRLNGEKLTDNATRGTGRNKIEIDGGVGSIKIKTIGNEQVNSETTPTFTRTYQLLNITPANEANSYYLTLKVFQGEVDTVLVNNIKENLTVSKNYEFTFSRKNPSTKLENTIESIFENTIIVSIHETTKTGLDQTQDAIN